jgi:hypothetical protein
MFQDDLYAIKQLCRCIATFNYISGLRRNLMTPSHILLQLAVAVAARGFP